MWKRLYLDPGAGGGAGGGEGGGNGGGEGDVAAQLAKAKSTINEMRANNVALQKQIDALTVRVGALGDVDPDEFKGLLDLARKAQDSEEAALLKAGKFDDVFARRTETLRKQNEKQTKTLAEQLAAAQATAGRYRDIVHAHTFTSDATATAAELKIKINPSALPDLLGRGRSVFAMAEDGTLKPASQDQDLTMKSWLLSLVDSAPHLFESAKGGGATGSGGGGGGKRVIDGSDPVALGQHAEAIRKGEVTVKM